MEDAGDADFMVGVTPAHRVTLWEWKSVVWIVDEGDFIPDSTKPTATLTGKVGFKDTCVQEPTGAMPLRLGGFSAELRASFAATVKRLITEVKDAGRTSSRAGDLFKLEAVTARAQTV